MLFGLAGLDLCLRRHFLQNDEERGASRVRGPAEARAARERHLVCTLQGLQRIYLLLASIVAC